MTMDSWADKDIELTCKRENPNWDGKNFDYGCACYQSVLKAYKTLMDDGHSGTSFGFLCSITIMEEPEWTGKSWMRYSRHFWKK